MTACITPGATAAGAGLRRKVRPATGGNRTPTRRSPASTGQTISRPVAGRLQPRKRGDLGGYSPAAHREQKQSRHGQPRPFSVQIAIAYRLVQCKKTSCFCQPPHARFCSPHCVRSTRAVMALTSAMAKGLPNSTYNRQRSCSARTQAYEPTRSVCAPRRLVTNTGNRQRVSAMT